MSITTASAASTNTSLAGIRAKTENADLHLKRFGEVHSRFQEANKDLIRREDRQATGQRVYVVSRDPDTSVFAMWAGDILHNLRGALDQLAYALCVAGAGAAAVKTVERRIHFPLTVGDASAYKASGTRRLLISLAKPGTEAVVAAVEPYVGGAGDILSQLNWLSNLDKHRLPIAVALGTRGVEGGASLHELIKHTNPQLFEAGRPRKFSSSYGLRTRSPSRRDSSCIANRSNSRCRKCRNSSFASN